MAWTSPANGWFWCPPSQWAVRHLDRFDSCQEVPAGWCSYILPPWSGASDAIDEHFFSPAQGKFRKNKKLTEFFFVSDWRRNQRLFGFFKIRVRKVWFFFQTLPVHQARQIHGQTGTLEQCWGGKRNAVWLITGRKIGYTYPWKKWKVIWTVRS